MNRLSLEVSDTQLHKLEHLAQLRNTSVDALVREAIEALEAESQDDIIRDPLFNIKPHETAAAADLSEQADHYLYGIPKR